MKLFFPFIFFLMLQFHQLFAQSNVGSEFKNVDAGMQAVSNISYKLSPSFKLKSDRKASEKYIVTCTNLNAAKFDAKEVQVLSKIISANTLIIKCTQQYLFKNILPNSNVIFIDKYIAPKTEISIIGYDRSMNGINALDYEIPNANGKNIVIGIKEQNIDEQDLDLYKRVVPSTLAASVTQYHANVIASIIGGSGNSFYDGRGVANACNFFSSSFSNLFVDDASILTQKNVTVQNHSYGTIPQQFYGAEAKNYDDHTWLNKNFVHVFSAGNKGTQAAAEGNYIGLANFANITGNFKMSKNVITVAATNNANVVAAESSAGPTYDGRLAPQITALGPNGTSDAAALVSGTVAVLQQIYKDSNNLQQLPASLAKAILYTTTADIHNAGIDYKTGYGLLNSFEAVKALQQRNYDGGIVSQNQVWTKNIIIASNIAMLKATLVWTDTAAQLNNNKALVNDLDIQVIETTTGNIFKPWVLSTVANIDSLNKLPIRKRDSLNSSEQVSIKLPSAGQYQIKVIGYNIVNPNINFHVAYSVDTLNTFSFTSPKHVSDINIQENEFIKIKWKTFVADTTNQLGNLFVSYNAGNNWQLLQQGIKIYKNEYAWQIKDTASTIVFKMETSFGTYFSKNIIVSRVLKPVVDFVCNDSFRLSWKKHVYASGYKIFAQTDSAFLKQVLIVTDTFKTFAHTSFPWQVYAVEPILSNGYAAARSVAFDISLQGVYCYYKTLNLNLLDNNNVELVLDLSIAEYVDSIFFEQVNVNGTIVQSIGSSKVSLYNLRYTQLSKIEQNGISYFRAKLKLKSGADVYTNIVDVLTSGKKNILFYPNPTCKSLGVKHILQQGVFINNALQFYDAKGNYLKGYKNIPNKVDIALFPVGVIIYKLINENNQVLETGKFVITD
jgi:Subtilase family